MERTSKVVLKCKISAALNPFQLEKLSSTQSAFNLQTNQRPSSVEVHNPAFNSQSQERKSQSSY
jgi:hypothetical protein